jgi:hypothetical protein
MDACMDARTDGRTDPLLELPVAAKNQTGQFSAPGILSCRRQRLLTAAGNISQHNPEELTDQYSHSLGFAIKLLGTEDPWILEALSFNSSLQDATSQTHMAVTKPAPEPTGSPRTKIAQRKMSFAFLHFMFKNKKNSNMLHHF